MSSESCVSQRGPLTGRQHTAGKRRAAEHHLGKEAAFQLLRVRSRSGATSDCRAGGSQAGMAVEAAVLEAKVIDIVVPPRLSIGQHTVRLAEQLEDGMGGLSS